MTDFELKWATLTVEREVRPDGGIRVRSDDLPGLILSTPPGVEPNIRAAAYALAEHAGLGVESVFSTEHPDRYALMYRQPLHHVEG